VLECAGLVRSLHGPSGRYGLTRPPSQIRAGGVGRVLEGSLALAGCVQDVRLCGRAQN